MGSNLANNKFSSRAANYLMFFLNLSHHLKPNFSSCMTTQGQKQENSSTLVALFINSSGNVNVALFDPDIPRQTLS